MALSYLEIPHFRIIRKETLELEIFVFVSISLKRTIFQKNEQLTIHFLNVNAPTFSYSFQGSPMQN